MGAELKIDWGQLTAKTIAAFVGGIMSEKLFGKFLGIFMKKIDPGYMVGENNNLINYGLTM